MIKRTIGGGLGISLEGTVDVEDGVEVVSKKTFRREN